MGSFSSCSVKVSFEAVAQLWYPGMMSFFEQLATTNHHEFEVKWVLSVIIARHCEENSALAIFNYDQMSRFLSQYDCSDV